MNEITAAIAGFDIDELASLILLRAVPGGDNPSRHQLVDVESVPTGVALEALGHVAPDQLSDGHALVECGQVKTTEQLGG